MTAIVVPVPVPVSALPLPDSADLATWPERMKELHRWMREDAAAFISALGESAYQNALHAVAMADSAAGSANFKGAWSALTGALNMPASVSHSGRIWLLNANLANVTTATPGVSGSWIDVSNFLMGVSTASAARAALDVYAKAETLAATRPNLIDNSNFSINSRAVSGTVVLAAGAYGHDRYKAGAGGCTYTFASSGGITTITVTAGSLVHPIHGDDIETATYTLSHGGTAQVRVVGGAYAASPIAVSATAGTQLNLEFGLGTIKQVGMVAGTSPIQWSRPIVSQDEIRCMRYTLGLSSHALGITQNVTDGYSAVVHFPVKMKSIPTLQSGALFTVGSGSAGTPVITSASKESVVFRNSANNWTTGAFVSVSGVLSCDL